MAFAHLLRVIRRHHEDVIQPILLPYGPTHTQLEPVYMYEIGAVLVRFVQERRMAHTHIFR